MGPVEEGQFLPEIVLRHRLIGQKHEILDNSGGRISLVSLNFQRFSLLIQHNLAFREIKVNGTPCMAFFPQNVRQLLHQKKHLCKLSVFRRHLGIVIRHNGIHRRVGHPAIRADDRFGNLMARHISLAVNLHQAAEGQPVLPLVERTDAVGKLVGQHGDHAIHQVHAGSTLEGFFIQRRGLLHIMADVRNVDSETIPVPGPLNADGVVQVLGLLAVYGNGRQISEILPSCPAVLLHLIGNLLQLVLYRPGEILRKIVGPDNRQNIYSRIVDMSQNLRDNAFRLLPLLLSKVPDFHHDLVAADCALRTSLGNKNIL